VAWNATQKMNRPLSTADLQRTLAAPSTSTMQPHARIRDSPSGGDMLTGSSSSTDAIQLVEIESLVPMDELADSETILIPTPPVLPEPMGKTPVGQELE